MTSANGRFATPLSAILLMVAVGGCINARAQVPDHQRHSWLACDVDWLTFDTLRSGPNFTVRVSFRKKPISSVKILLWSEDSQSGEHDRRIVATSETDPEGVARFFAIPSGKYEARIEGGLLTSGEKVEVDANRYTGAELAFEWPQATIVTQNVRGKLTASDTSHSGSLLPLQGVQVQLLELRTAKLLARTYTDNDGYYSLPSSGPGLYVVQFNENQEVNSHTNEIAVEVRPHAIEEQIPALEIDRVCGTGVSRASQEPDQVLFDRGASALEHGRFDVARLTLQTLVNTYPHSAYTSKAELLLEDSRITKCGESWNASPCDADAAGATPY